MKRGLVGTLAALLLAGCSTVPPRVGDPPPELPDVKAEADFRAVSARWSRHSEVYSQLDSLMFVAATEQSPEFRKAKAERLAAFQELPPNARDLEVAKELAEAQKGYDFFLGVHTANSRFNDFDRTASIWRVALHTTAGEVVPASIERVRPDPNVRAIYPYLGDFWIGYRVHFPTTLPDGRPLVSATDQNVELRLASAVGHTELTFPAPPPVAVAAPAP